MKRIGKILSVLLVASVLLTSAFAATPTPAIEKLKVNGLPIIGDTGYVKHVIYDGLPKTGTEEILESGVRFAAYPTKTANLQATNGGEMITAAFKEGTTEHASEVLETIFADYPVTPSTHRGIVCYEWKVRFNKAVPTKIWMESYDCNGTWAISKNPAVAIFGSDQIYTLGIVYNTITGAWNLTKNGEQIPTRSGNDYFGTFTGQGGLRAPWLRFQFGDVEASIDILDAKLTYYEKTRAYSKVLYDGIPSATSSSTNENGVTTTVTAGTIEDGKLVEPTGCYTYMNFPVNSTDMPAGGKIYWEYTVSFTEIPTEVWINARKNSWEIAWNLKNNWGMTLSLNTEFRIGLEYDIKTGNYAYYNGGVLLNSGTMATPETGIGYTYLEIKGTTTMKCTVSNMKLVYTEDYQLPENVYLEGIDNSSKVTWTQNEGMSFEAMRNNDTRLTNNVGELVMTNSDATSDYSRLYFKFDEKPSAEATPDKLYAEIKCNLSAAPLGFHVGAYSDSTEIFSRGLSASYFEDSTKDYTVALVYNVSSGEWWTLVDGEKTGVSGKISEEYRANGISNFYFQWRGTNAADVFTVKNIKAGYEAGTDTVGNITIADNEASVTINKLPYSPLGNEISFIVAQYQGKRLQSIKINKLAVKAGNNILTAELPEAADGTTVKVFAWSDENVLTPLTASVTR